MHLAASGGDQILSPAPLATFAQYQIANVGPANRIVVQDVNGNTLAYLPPNWFANTVAQSNSWDVQTFSKNSPFTISFPSVKPSIAPISISLPFRWVLPSSPPSMQIGTSAKAGKGCLVLVRQLGR